MTTPTGRVVNPLIQEIDGTVYAELYVDGQKITALNPVPTTGGGGGGGAMTVANGADVALGATTDAEVTGNGSLIAILKRIRTILSGTLATSRTWTLTSGTDSVAVTGSFWQTTQPVSLATNTPDVTDRSARLLGHVTVDNASLTVSNGQTQPLTDTQLRASAVPVSGTFYPATQPVSGTVTVANPTTNPETGLAKDGTDITSPTTMPAGGVGIRGWLSAIWTKLNGILNVSVQNASLAVTGTFWQAIQPVSLATNTPDPIDRAARLLGHVTVDNASLTVSNGQTQPLTDTQLRASAVPVSLATNTPTLAAGTNTVGNLNEIRAATSYVTNTGASGAAVTLTLNGAGAGLFHYITSIEVTAYAAAARTGGATPWLVTTTNVTGSPVYTFSTAGAIGTTDTQRVFLATPLKTTTANTATTFVAPAATGVIWRIQVTYFVAT